MRNNRWLRFGLASSLLISAGVGAVLVACGSDDEETLTAAKTDSGATDATPADTGSGGDARTDGPAPPVDAGTNAKIQLVNAATDFGPSNALGALRICYGLGPAGTIAPLPPLPDRISSPGQTYPGVLIGTGGNVQGTGADLTTVAVTPYIMNAKALFDNGYLKPDAAGDPGTSCSAILDPDAGIKLQEGRDYWKLTVIPANTFVKEKSFILVLTGCAADSAQPDTKCGADFVAGDAGVGNLKVTVYEVDRATAIAADKIGTQFIHASAAGASYLSPTPVTPGYITGADAGSFKGLGTDGGASTVLVGEKTPLVQVSGVTFVAGDAGTSFTASPLISGLSIRLLPDIQAFTYGATVPENGNYRNGAAFTFIALGDPEGSGTKQFHYIALPNDPKPETYAP